MKRFEFQLGSLLRLRAQAKQLAELRQAQALNRLEDARRHVSELEHELAGVCQPSADNALDRPIAATLLAQRGSVEAIQRQLIAARQSVTDANRAYEKAMDAYKELAIQVESLETLREHQRDVHQEQVEKQVQTQLDENVLRQWDTAKRDAGRHIQ
ncbi:MAG: flagellar FliJ family protein [Planctomycetales bacterium]|nr:flagellar FliJ family protein [Planctomycetales bacterium]MCA9161574.1 flagellar FliJ family protein [Planctomycetales bacterium]MCA9207419.1 flagellar FliJ family protein [Planctomycetales bacterium]MCA9226005.1 flagellar FliJ family protein [Planctomycetales bacterium]